MTSPLARFRGEPVVRATRLAYVHLARPSLDETTAFLADFGIERLSLDGDIACYGSPTTREVFYVARREPRARFLGFGVCVSSEAELRELVDAGLAREVEPDPFLAGCPSVQLRDPHGFEVRAVFARQPKAAIGAHEVTPDNTPARTRRVDSPVPVASGVPPVVRLGHVVLETPVFRDALQWYQRTLGMIVSDYQHLPDGTPIVAFCRFDCGEQPTDHHSLALGHAFRTGLDHIAFEVENIEAVTRGQHRMSVRGWKHAWGVGRHIMGSQVFDYWYDPCGTKHEHYADGDKVTANFPMGSSPFGPSYLAQWGPPMPSTFIGGPVSPKLVFDAFRSVASGQMSLSQLLRMAKAAKLRPKSDPRKPA